MATSFQTLSIIGRLRNPGVKETLRALVQHLSQLKKKLLIEKETADSLDLPHLATISREKIGQADLVIVVGGDGSLLNAAHAVIGQNTPVLGINRGSLGFLTDIHPAEFKKIDAILEGHYTIEKRFLLSASVELHQKTIGQADALNEIALIPDAIPHMIEFETYIDNQFVCSQDSDGLIVATPTGSTAYALSAGGPILHPQLDAIVLVPMFPHSLNHRTIVVEGNKTIQIVLTPNNTTTPRLTADGQPHIPIPPGCHIQIKKKKEPLHLVHPLDYNYYETLRSKLHWGKKLHYSE